LIYRPIKAREVLCARISGCSASGSGACGRRPFPGNLPIQSFTSDVFKEMAKKSARGTHDKDMNFASI
jgi:hypothetical protein